MTQPSIYSYFGLKPSFVVDTERLEAAYLAAIKKCIQTFSLPVLLLNVV